MGKWFGIQLYYSLIEVYQLTINTIISLQNFQLFAIFKFRPSQYGGNPQTNGLLISTPKPADAPKVEILGLELVQTL